MMTSSTPEQAKGQLDAHAREIVRWHFSAETGSPFWLDWAKKAGWKPAEEITSFDDIIARFPHFEDEWLRDVQPELWVPAKYKGHPFNIFETGGTTGMPKQRIGWDDYKVDYSEFSEKISDEHFPRNHYWLMMGPTGPRRLRLAIEHLANVRGSSCYFIDLDPRWVKKVLANKQFDQARAYWSVVDQVQTVRHRRVSGLFTTPKLLEALSKKLNLWMPESARLLRRHDVMPIRSVPPRKCSVASVFIPPMATRSWVSPPVPLRPEDTSVTTTRRAACRAARQRFETDRSPGGLRPVGRVEPPR
jgi:hypothetical protein